MRITQEMVDALRHIVSHKLAMWDAALILENLVKADIDTSCQAIEDLAIVADEDLSFIDVVDVRTVLAESKPWGSLTDTKTND